MSLRHAGWRHDPPVSSQMEQCTRFAATPAADPELDPPVSRAVSYTSLNEKATQYIGIARTSGCRPYRASSSAARSSASGWRRNASQAAGQLAGRGPADGARSHSALHDTDRSPRTFSVLSALIWPAFGMPATIPYCCCTLGSELVASMRPNSIGGPAYSSNFGSTDVIAVVDVWKETREPARTGPAAAGTAAPSRVTSCVHGPLYARARSMYDSTIARQVVCSC